jgi:hypothetical protein
LHFADGLWRMVSRLILRLEWTLSAFVHPIA